MNGDKMKAEVILSVTEMRLIAAALRDYRVDISELTEVVDLAKKVERWIVDRIIA